MPSLNLIIKNDVYPFDVMVSLGQSDKDVLKSLSKFKGKQENKSWWMYRSPTQRGFYGMDDKNASIIRMRCFPDTNEDYADLQHEIFHAVYNIFEVVGMKLSEDSEEAYAYMISCFTRQIYDAISNLK